MPPFLLTPASVSYLNQSILAALIIVTLVDRLRSLRLQKPSQQDVVLLMFFGCVLLFSILLFLESALPPSERLYPVYMQNTVLALTLSFLMQFAYTFPHPDPRQIMERRLTLLATAAYLLWEASLSFWRLQMLEQGHVQFRPNFADLFPIAGFLWVILIFIRKAANNWSDPVHRYFALIFLIPLYLATLNLLRTFYYISSTFFHINMSVGILATIFLFVLHYLTSQPGRTSFILKVSGAMLTAMLALYGMIAWLAAPAYAAQYRPNLLDHRSLRFTPNPQGGYDVTEIPFRFEQDFGDNLGLTDSAQTTARVDFDFPFFGQMQRAIFIMDDGFLGIGADVERRDVQFGFGPSPAILPLFVDLAPEHSAHGGVFLHRRADRLLVTYLDVPAFRNTEDLYTFQVALYADGRFDITYNGLPARISYYLGESPDTNVEAIGVKPAAAPGGSVDFASLPLRIGPEGAIQNEYLAFRYFIHEFMGPMAVAIVGSSLFVLILSDALFRYGLARPLRMLLQGVQALDGGQRNVSIPILSNDEIGSLTQSFNNLSGELNALITGLENRVAERTSDLVAANEQLHKLSVAVEQSPSAIVITDTTANIEYVNQAFVQSTGYTFEEVRGRNPRILKSGQTTPEVYQQMWASLTAGRPWRGELINQKKDGQVFWEATVITPILDSDGQLTHYAAIKEDVTARVMAEKALRESEEQYRLLFDLESDAIFIIRNADGQILEANDAAVTLYGYTREELLTRKNTDLSAEPENTQQATHTEFPINQVVVIPLRYHQKFNGAVFPVEITARFITWKGESVHIAAIRDVTQRVQIEQELVRLATTDPLTGLYNRRHFNALAEQIIRRIRPPDHLSILLIDVDHYKSVNDTYGHAIGDMVLRELADRLGQSLRPTDVLARYGGEEFIILLLRSSHHEAEEVARRLCRTVDDHIFRGEDGRIHITVSIGVASLDHEGHNLDDLIHHADIALYQAKDGGRNQWKIWEMVKQ